MGIFLTGYTQHFTPRKNTVIKPETEYIWDIQRTVAWSIKDQATLK